MPHTPGPWHLHDTEAFTVCGPDHLAILIADAVSRPVEENDANARLACLAPDLLKRLVKLRNEASGFLAMCVPTAHGQTNINVLRLRIAEADDVIAKAEAQ